MHQSAATYSAIMTLLSFLFYAKECKGLDTFRGRTGETREKRSVVNLYQMISCATPCDPISYKGYGCYCGFMGDGEPVDGIDKCCQQHDHCYSKSTCNGSLHYFISYNFKCNDGRPVCEYSRGRNANCGNYLCECDKSFVKCLKQYRCPSSRPVCTSSPWRQILKLGSFGQKIAILLQFLL